MATIHEMRLRDRPLYERDPLEAVDVEQYHVDKLLCLKLSQLVQGETYRVRLVTDPDPESEAYATDVQVQIKKRKFVQRHFPFVVKKFLRIDSSPVSEEGEVGFGLYTQKVRPDGTIFQRGLFRQPTETGYFLRVSPDDDEGIRTLVPVDSGGPPPILLPRVLSALRV